MRLHQKSFHLRLQHANKSAVIGYTRDDRVEGFSDPLLHRDRRQPLRHLTFDFPGGIFFLRTVRRNGTQFVVGIRILGSND